MHLKKVLGILFFSIVPLLSFGQSDKNYSLKYQNKTNSLETILQQYIQIPSISGEEKLAGDFIKDVCIENNLTITEFGNTNGNYNFAASILPLDSNKPNIIFLNHIDVIPELDTKTRKAYSGEIFNDEIYGRGSIDNKGAAIMQLASVVAFAKNTDNSKLKYNVTFLAVSCEETQCEGGVKYVINEFFDKLNPKVVIGEGPTELSTLISGEFKQPVFGISIAHKRAFWLKLTRKFNTLGHASVTPISYSNKEMIESLARITTEKSKVHFNKVNTDILKSIGKQKSGIEKFVLKHPRFFKPFLISKLRKEPELFSLFTNTITVTNINSNNNTINKIPKSTYSYLDCRLLPETDEGKFLNQIKKRLKNDSIGIEIMENMPRTKPSSTTSDTYLALKNAIQTTYKDSDVIPLLMPNINDLGAFRVKGIDCYASIPIYLSIEHIESIHNANERIPIPKLYDGSKVYHKYLELLNQQ